MDYRKTEWYANLKSSSPECIYCDEQLNNDTFTVDHILPQSKGGMGTKDNLKPCCRFCNGLRGNMDYNEFITLYPKEKLLKLKEYTLNNKDINGVLIMNESIEHIDIIRNNISILMEKKNEIERLKTAYKQLSDKVRNEIVYSKNLSASDGYKLYVKQREIDRQYLRYYNEHKFLDKYTETLNDLENTISNMHSSMTASMVDTSLSKSIPTLEDDIENVINNTVDSIISQSKKSNGKPDKTYHYNSSNKSQKLQSIKSVWKIIEDDRKQNLFKCYGRK